MRYKVVKLRVNIPFHSKLMAPVEITMKKALKKLKKPWKNQFVLQDTVMGDINGRTH